MAASATRAEMPVFSYAQAAKGLASAASTQPAKSADQSQAEQSSHAPTPRVTSTESCREPEKVESVGDSEAKSVTASSKNPVSGDSTPNPATAAPSTGPKEETSQIPNGTSDISGEKPSQESTSAEKPAGDVQDASKAGAKTEKKPEQPSDSAVKPAVGELKAAPIPAVNVWQERMEKAKANAARNAARTLPVKQPGPQTAGDDADKAGNKERDSSVQGKDRRRVDPGKARDEGSRKSSGRFSRPNDEPAEAPLPPAVDDSAWPTPQTAVGEEKRKAQERSEKQERAEKPSGTRAKWTPVPYVPTAVFSTPLPSSARRGGRAPRGGRDSGRGGTHGGNDSKSVSETTSHSKQGPGVERGRNDSSGAARSNSLPAQARRAASADANGQGDHRRSQHPHGGNRFRGEGRSKGSEHATASTTNGGASTTGGEGTNKSFRDQRAGKFPEFTPSNKAVDNAPKSAPLPSDGHGNSRFNGGPRSEFSRDANGVRDHKEFKGDRDHPRERQDSRPERGRGGFRGRGGHYANGGHYNNPQYQHAFGPKGFNQRAFQNGGQSNHRLPFRSPPMANAPGVYNPYGLPDFGAFYPGYPPVPPGPMTAVPYQPFMEPYTLMGLIQMQLDYYFSVDNLCKDMFLRRHMDSQGFVPLTFIANFKRIKNLTEDLDLIRHCCHQARNVEHQLGADGVDRVRPREKWQQWVLPMDQRDPSARHDSPPAVESQPVPEGEKPEENVPAASSAQPPLTNGSTPNGTHVQSNGLPNGAAAAPEFTPAAAQNEVANHLG
ncbi:hypothetical protein VTN49DRAFT_4399 [Thermomyces lanuginosus]|uniref:uncharacterized protein n=1 Tax=Thermomyces lanuginosus TaxID=5541 RepID=UPI0037434276